jgi:hypothetical protein
MKPDQVILGRREFQFAQIKGQTFFKGEMIIRNVKRKHKKKEERDRKMSLKLFLLKNHMTHKAQKYITVF